MKCINVVIAIEFEDGQSFSDDSDPAISSKEEETFVCDTPGELSDVSSDASDEGRCSVLAWQIGDLPDICSCGASYHMSKT